MPKRLKASQRLKQTSTFLKTATSWIATLDQSARVMSWHCSKRPKTETTSSANLRQDLTKAKYRCLRRKLLKINRASSPIINHRQRKRLLRKRGENYLRRTSPVNPLTMIHLWMSSSTNPSDTALRNFCFSNSINGNGRHKAWSRWKRSL